MKIKYFDCIIDLYKNRFKPSVKSIRLPKAQQITLPFIGVENCGHVRMGLFYELLTKGLFGGVLFDSLKQPHEHYKGWIKPDVLIKEDKVKIYESKALTTGHQLNLLDEQVKKYYHYQILYPEDKIYYAMWRHRFKKIMSCKLSLQDLYKSLSKLTVAGIILPFSIIMKLYNTEDERIKIKRYENRESEGLKFLNCTRVGSKFLNQFILSPDSAINTIGLDPKRFIQGRRMSPSNFKIDNKKINQFPLITIKDKEYSNWARRLSGAVPF